MVKHRKLKMELRGTAKERSISFTKRRQGLFNKAANFSVITGAHIALWVTSPCLRGKVYTFTSHHSIDAILNPFLEGGVPEPVNDATKISAMSLWHEINTLESNNSRPRKSSNEDNVATTQGCHWDLEEYENSNSLEELKNIVNRLESLRSSLITRMNSKPISHALPLRSYAPNTTVDICSVELTGVLNHGVGTTFVGAENSSAGINQDAMPSTSIPVFGFCQNVSDVDYDVQNNARNILLSSGFNQDIEDNVGGWLNNSNVACDEIPNHEFFHDQAYENTESEKKDEKQVFPAHDSVLGWIKNELMNDKFNDVEDGAKAMGWNHSSWNLGIDQYGKDESLWRYFDADSIENLPAVPFELEDKPISDEWFSLPSFGMLDSNQAGHPMALN